MPHESILQHLTLNINGPVRHEKLGGIDHLVVPTVMIVEGVMNGSKGPLYYPAAELESSEPAWNHKPIVVYHPRKGSACDPDVLNTRKVGVILNTAWDAPKLRTESWLDVLACNRVDKRIIECLEANKAVEVSTGVYTTNEKTSGSFGDKPYDAIARNYRPDHLAILPDQIGACSIADGGGLLQLNAEALREGRLDPVTLSAIMGKTGLRPILTENEKSFGDIASEIYSILQSRFGWNCYIDAILPSGWVVYCIEKQTFKVGYKVTDKEVTLENDPEEVYRKVSYVTVNGEAFQTVSNQKAVDKENLTMGMKESIDALIANGGYEEADRPVLEKFTEAKLTALAGKIVVANKEEKPAPTPIPSPFKAPVENADKVLVDKATLDKLTAFVANQEQQENTAKSSFCDLLVATDACPFNKEHLMKQDMPTLQGMATMLKIGAPPAPNYFGAQGALNLNAGNTQPKVSAEESEEAYLPPTMNFGAEKQTA